MEEKQLLTFKMIKTELCGHISKITIYDTEAGTYTDGDVYKKYDYLNYLIYYIKPVLDFSSGSDGSYAGITAGLELCLIKQ